MTSVIEELDGEKSSDVLSTPIAKVEKLVPVAVSSKSSLKTAAFKLREDRGGCLVTGGKKVVTPWGLVMKPWHGGA